MKKRAVLRFEMLSSETNEKPMADSGDWCPENKKPVRSFRPYRFFNHRAMITYRSSQQQYPVILFLRNIRAWHLHR